MQLPRSPGSGTGESQPADAPLALVDEDTGPTFVLEGRIVTMTRRGVIAGRLAVRGGRIAAIVAADEALPARLRTAPVVRTEGTILPGAHRPPQPLRL